MDFEQLLELIGDEPTFKTGLLLAGDIEPAQVYLQLARWKKAGRIYQLRRGLYILAPPYQKTRPHPFLLANAMGRASYVSCQSALAHYSLIPEFVPVTISFSTTRPTSWETLVGIFQYHHIKKDLFFGYQYLQLDERQSAYVATPEKALLDLVYLTPKAATPEYLRELRLHNLEVLDTSKLRQQAETSGSLKLVRAVEFISAEVISQSVEYESIPARIDSPGS